VSIMLGLATSPSNDSIGRDRHQTMVNGPASISPARARCAVRRPQVAPVGVSSLGRLLGQRCTLVSGRCQGHRLHQPLSGIQSCAQWFGIRSILCGADVRCVLGSTGRDRTIPSTRDFFTWRHAGQRISSPAPDPSRRCWPAVEHGIVRRTGYVEFIADSRAVLLTTAGVKQCGSRTPSRSTTSPRATSPTSIFTSHADHQ